jgi:hypothetical protein
VRKKFGSRPRDEAGYFYPGRDGMKYIRPGDVEEAGVRVSTTEKINKETASAWRRGYSRKEGYGNWCLGH